MLCFIHNVVLRLLKPGPCTQLGRDKGDTEKGNHHSSGSSRKETTSTCGYWTLEIHYCDWRTEFLILVNLNLKTNTHLNYWKTLRYVWNKLGMLICFFDCKINEISIQTKYWDVQNMLNILLLYFYNYCWNCNIFAYTGINFKKIS